MRGEFAVARIDGTGLRSQVDRGAPGPTARCRFASTDAMDCLRSGALRIAPLVRRGAAALGLRAMHPLAIVNLEECNRGLQGVGALARLSSA